MSLRPAFPLALAALCLSGCTLAAADPVEAAHAEIWRRFISPHGTFYDYTSLEGGVELPTAAEVAADQPNALGWWSPIENGGFFGGLYLDALCKRWERLRTEDAAREARTIAGGLLKLAEVGKTPGFIARGFADDGTTHWAASSSDQTYPWFYGLWRYAKSGLPDPAERERVVAVMERVALGLEANGWKMPCDRGGFGHFGHWTGGFAGTRGTLTGAEPQFDAAARLLFVLRAMHDLTGKERWLALYRGHLHGKPQGSERTRLEICAAGVSYVAPGEPPRYPESPPIWTSASSQAALRGLVEMDEEAAPSFRQGLETNAAGAAPFIGKFRDYDNDNSLPFDIRWRALLTTWRPQHEIADAVKLATEQYRVWNRQSPRRVAEADAMRDPLFAAWIVALAGDVSSSRGEITAALAHYRWEKLHTCLFFMAECVHEEMLGAGR